MWVDSVFKTIGEALGLIKQERDPETIRLSKIRKIDDELKSKREKITELLLSPILKETRDAVSVELGVILNDIVRLREERRGLER